MSLSEIEKDLWEQKEREIKDKRIEDEQYKQYKRDRSAKLSQNKHYLEAIEKIFWEQCERLGRLIGNKINPYYRRKTIFFFIPLSSIKDGKLIVGYENSISGSDLTVSVEYLDQTREGGACLEFNSHLYSSGFRSYCPSSLKEIVKGRYPLSDHDFFDVDKACKWLDDMFGDLYQSLK